MSYTKRAFFKNYKLPGRYMITLSGVQGRPPASVVDRLNGEPSCRLTELGSRLEEFLLETFARLKKIKLEEYVFMPDHLHMLLDVRQRLDRELGSEIAAMKKGFSKIYSDYCGLDHTESYYRPLFNDRIIFDDEQYETERLYLLDNPRRLVIMRENPDLFQRYNHLIIGDMEFAAFGNIFLLRRPQRFCVRIHRSWSAGEFDAHMEKALAVAQNGGVLCSQGRLLLLAPWPDSALDRRISRSEAMQLNDMAARIAALGPDAGFAIRR